MNKNSRVFHERGFTSKLGYAEKSIREGNSVWVTKGVLYRDATPDEMWEAMSMTAEERVAKAAAENSLGHREVSGIIFKPCEAGLPATRREKYLAWQARYFVKNGVMPELKAA